MENLKDKTIICKDCGEEFVFSVNEQQFYAEKGFTNEPARCKACRNKRKAQRNSFKKNNNWE
ncbi:MAG: cytochrome C551 [Mollicutes bacterium]|nr:cytochrome C551 [Mollicutes bacterium]